MLPRQERARGVTLRILDTDAIAQVASEEAAMPLECGFRPWAIAVHSDDVAYVVCGEGVGWKVTDKEPFQFGLYRKVEGAITVAPTFDGTLTLAQLRPYITEQEIDLADLIRVHNARLEDNFWLLHRRLTKPVS